MINSQDLDLAMMPSTYGRIPGPPGVPNHNALAGYISSGERISGTSFGGTIREMVRNTNELMGKPEQLSVKAVHTGQVDIHEIMIAMGKSDVAFKLIAAVSQKVVGAFDKLTSMQI